MSTREEFWREVSEITDLYARRDFIKQLEEEFSRQRKITEEQIVKQEMEEVEQSWTAADDQGYH